HLTPRPLALAVVLRVAEGQLHRNRLLGSMIDCGRSGRIVQSFPNNSFNPPLRGALDAKVLKRPHF
ncbi:hypothetical protein, partial [Xanthomonas phaseoli]|uniref:hypothetical protein n=1 Tax=Xanthomonas phaseoli TaxID=1985254 RepID=UPI001C2ED8C4